MGQRLKVDDKMKYLTSIPGPGAHDPEHIKYLKKVPAYSMGSKYLSQSASKLILPGPGSYSSSSQYLKSKAPSFGFGTSKRSVLAKPDVGPGPGAYKLPSKLAEMPDFAMP